jgi:hypothetical protein
MHDMANVVSLVHGSTEGHCDDVHWKKIANHSKKCKLGSIESSSIESKENLDKSATKEEATQLLSMLFERSQEKR